MPAMLSHKATVSIGDKSNDVLHLGCKIVQDQKNQ